MLLPNSLFLYGLRSTGKTLVAVSVLQSLNVKICHCNCVEFYTTKLMYETILNKLSGKKCHKFLFNSSKRYSKLSTGL